MSIVSSLAFRGSGKIKGNTSLSSAQTRLICRALRELADGAQDATLSRHGENELKVGKGKVRLERARAVYFV